MYTIERRQHGYILEFYGTIDVSEMQKWYEEIKFQLDNEPRGIEFGCIIDMVNLEPLTLEASKIMQTGQRYFKMKGMYRSAVLVSSARIRAQFINIGVLSGITVTERYIDVSSVDNPKELAVKWVKYGNDKGIQ